MITKQDIRFNQKRNGGGKSKGGRAESGCLPQLLVVSCDKLGIVWNISGKICPTAVPSPYPKSFGLSASVPQTLLALVRTFGRTSGPAKPK